MSKSLFNNFLVLCGLSVLLILSSCNDKKAETVELSKEFKPIFDSTHRLLEGDKINQALKYLDTSVAHIHKLTTTDKFRVYSIKYVIENKINHNSVKALKYADSMLITLQETNDLKLYSTLLAEGNFARGDALFQLGRYSESYVNYYEGYLIGSENYDKCTLSDYTYRMGMISYKQGNYKYAVTYFKQSFDQSGASCKDEFTTFFRQQEILDNIGLSYRNSGRADSALAYFTNALSYINDHTKQYVNRADIFEVARAVIYGNMADVLYTKNQFVQAKSLLKQSITTNLKKGNDNADAELSEVKLGRIYLKLHQDALLLPLLNSLRAQLDSVKNIDAEAGWNMLIGTYYKNNGDYNKALPYLEIYHQIKDSINTKSQTLKQSNVIEHFKNINNHYQIVALRNKQRIYLYTGTIFLSMSVIILFLIYRNYRKSHKEMVVVNELNKQVILQKDELERTLFDLENSSREKDRILRTVAHDLRNPLGGIASLSGVMADDADYNHEQLELLNIIKETAHDSLELINEILEATNNIISELHTQPVDINILLNNSVELMRFKAAEKNQKIMLNTLDTPELLMISREKIWRVISNLISNAIKFSPVGSDIRVSLTDNKDHVQIAVNDHGIGIPESIKNKIFNMFTDAKRPGTLGEKSFGLGLSICRQIIETHHGKIWFESSNDKGTTFFVRLSKNKKAARTLLNDGKLLQKTGVPLA